MDEYGNEKVGLMYNPQLIKKGIFYINLHEKKKFDENDIS